MQYIKSNLHCINNNSAIQTILNFFIEKLIVAIAVIAASISIVEGSGRLLIKKIVLNENAEAMIIGVTESVFTILGYILAFTVVGEKAN